MPESVELNGMTINLVESKAAYDDMTKNPNEMYLVEKEYELEFNVITTWNPSISEYETNVELISGNINDVLKKVLNSDHDYYPRAKFNIASWYMAYEYTRSLILDCVIEEDTGGATTYPYFKYLCYMTNEMLSLTPDYDIYIGRLARFSIVIYVSEDTDEIIASIDSGGFGIGGSSFESFYSKHKAVTLGYFID